MNANYWIKEGVERRQSSGHLVLLFLTSVSAVSANPYPHWNPWPKKQSVAAELI